MTLDHAFKDILSKRKTHTLSEFCSFQLLYNSLSKEDQKTLDTAFEKKYPTNLIIQALRNEGHKASADTLRLHRDGTCRCPK